MKNEMQPEFAMDVQEKDQSLVGLFRSRLSMALDDPKLKEDKDGRHAAEFYLGFINEPSYDEVAYFLSAEEKANLESLRAKTVKYLIKMLEISSEAMHSPAYIELAAESFAKLDMLKQKSLIYKDESEEVERLRKLLSVVLT